MTTIKNLKLTSIALTCLLSLASQPTLANQPELSLDLSDTSVSGLSSGGYMANQFHLAYSNWIKRAGIIAAGPFYCAQNSIATALSQCVNKQDAPISNEILLGAIKQFETKGLIAPLSNLTDSRVWILHGNKDQRVIAPVTDALVEQYKTWLADDNLLYVNDKPFAHHFPTLSTGHSCETSESPFLGDCGYDAAGAMLKHLYPDLAERSSVASGKLHSIDQQQLGGSEADSLADTGYVYVPKNCSEGQVCKLHISFHGCNQNAQAVDTQYAQGSGLNLWADSNNMVVLYPQTKKSAFMPLNPQACWDWWGYTDENYATNQGQQIKAVKNIANALNQ